MKNVKSFTVLGKKKFPHFLLDKHVSNYFFVKSPLLVKKIKNILFLADIDKKLFIAIQSLPHPS